MLENVTVTLSLQDFDTFRAGEAAHRAIASQLASCFDYLCTKNETPAQCEKCKKDSCEGCKVYDKNPLYTEKMTVNVNQLITVAKDYSCWGKDIETDLGTIKIERIL
jgi:hypothetical protein